LIVFFIVYNYDARSNKYEILNIAHIMKFCLQIVYTLPDCKTQLAHWFKIM